MNKIKIYVMAHKKFQVPDNSIYKPMQVGAALHEELGYVPDNTGDNISNKNPFYNELTGLYWMWKNEQEADIMGLCHYRRFFLNDDSQLVSAEQIEKLLKSNDMIVTPRLCYPKGTSVYDRYAEKHYAKELDLTREAITRICPEYLTEYDAVINGREMYYANMMIASGKLICDYAKWLFEILFDVENNLDMSDYNDYDKRVFGFIAERLVMVWVRCNKLRVAEVPVGLMGEKSETVEVIKKSAEMLKEGGFKEVLEYLDAVKETRPDLFFTDSDTNKELACIYTFAEVMKVEANAGKNNLVSYSTDYKVLIELYKILQELICDSSRNKELYRFIISNNLSIEFVVFTIRKICNDSENVIRTYNNLASNYLDAGNLNMARLYVELALKEGKG